MNLMKGFLDRFPKPLVVSVLMVGGTVSAFSSRSCSRTTTRQHESALIVE